MQDHTSRPSSAHSLHLTDISSESKNESKSFNRITEEQKPSQLNIPVKRSNFKKFINPTSAFDETLSAISAICDLCEFHQLGDALGEAWLRAMNPEFTHAPIQLIPALDRVIPTNQNWLSVLPADMNPIEAEEIAQSYLEVDTDTLIVTRMELSKRCGVLLRAAYQGLKLTLVSKSPELVEGLQCGTPEIMLERMLAACEASL